MDKKPFQILATNHTSFTVAKLDSIIEFFCDGLGFKLLSRASRNPNIIQKITSVDEAEVEIAFIQGPNHRIELIQYLSPNNQKSVEMRPCDSGFSHVAYDVDDIDAAIATARTYNFVPLGDPVTIDKGPNTGSRVVYIRNQDGISIEFIEKNENAWG